MSDWLGSSNFGVLLIGTLAITIGSLAALAWCGVRRQEARDADPTIPAVMAAYGLVDAREFVAPTTADPAVAAEPRLPVLDIAVTLISGAAVWLPSTPWWLIAVVASALAVRVATLLVLMHAQALLRHHLQDLAGGVPASAAGDTSPSQLPTHPSG